jgi:hypothetical protein
MLKQLFLLKPNATEPAPEPPPKNPSSLTAPKSVINKKIPQTIPKPNPNTIKIIRSIQVPNWYIFRLILKRLKIR